MLSKCDMYSVSLLFIKFSTRTKRGRVIYNVDNVPISTAFECIYKYGDNYFHTEYYGNERRRTILYGADVGQQLFREINMYL